MHTISKYVHEKCFILKYWRHFETKTNTDLECKEADDVLRDDPLNQEFLLLMWELDYTESWALKNWCFWTVVLEKTLESPSDCKEIQSVNPKGNQPWIFMGRTDAEAPILGPPDVKGWLIGKDPDAGKDWRWEEKGTTEDEMAEWHHWLNGHEFEQALGVGDGQGGLACCSPWGRKESDTTERLTWIETQVCLELKYVRTAENGPRNPSTRCRPCSD